MVSNSPNELSIISLELQSNNIGLSRFSSFFVTHGGLNSLGGGEFERFVLLFPNNDSSTYAGENCTGL